MLALGVASKIFKKREIDRTNGVGKPNRRMAYIVNSLKHPKEVEKLREIYSNGFYLIGINSDESRRKDHLIKSKFMTENEAKDLIKRDMDEIDGFGQHTRDTFEMADFYVHLSNHDQAKNSIWRILDLIFGHPHQTPTFDEFAMFMAFTSALRSADLSRQVGAVIAKDNEIIALGANDAPKFGGGSYWSEWDAGSHEYIDHPDGRDYIRGKDPNKAEQARIIENIIQALEIQDDEEKQQVKEKLSRSKIKDITEYGRVVHAEMDALLMCSRNNVSTRGATIYCTTYPCHNCAKHIIAAGITKVIYVEPYPKSKALEFHSDAISTDVSEEGKKVVFTPFVGIGPRKFFDLFSMSLGSGYNKIRKNKDGSALKWQHKDARMRSQLLPVSYLEREIHAATIFDSKRRDM
ncbi:anti-phage dCTP deaminase [Cohnella kolymensis]|uniref:anti-phage dCTP deaminase n=1 Tax=Cohnella kolymensis TaxID=1590652 RepID=UPI002285B013|nr:anti-phage dCTP deaminase [Cohnella kolymensis]